MESVDVVFVSETWEREELPLKEVIKLDNFEIVSDVHQRNGKGGRSAVMVNKDKFTVKNLTNTDIQIPWGVEAVWALLTPLNLPPNSSVKKIACCAVYSKPKSKKKTLLLDHISDSYNLLRKKYGEGLHFIISGDTNDLGLTPILNLDTNFRQIVQKWTRLDPPAILDPVIMTLSNLYQEPLCLDPLDSDKDKSGVKADHLIVLAKPVSNLIPICSRRKKLVKLRSYTKSAFEKMRSWLTDFAWDEVYKTESAHQKADIFQTLLLAKTNEFFPEKTHQFTTDDQPWMTTKIKKLDRKRKRVYHKQRKSEKFTELNDLFKVEVKKAKSKFYEKKIAFLKQSDPRKWYISLKKISNDHKEQVLPSVQDINELGDQEQAEIIAEKFAAIQNEFDPLKSEKIAVPEFADHEIPQFHPAQVWFVLSRLNVNKSTVPGDIPARILKHIAAFICEPLTHIFNSCIKRGEYPQIFKSEICTPVPKVFPTENISQLRNISGLLNFDKIFEKLLSQLIVSDMESSMDKAQFGNQKQISIQHYLIQLLHRILTAVDKNSGREAFAVIANFIDWKDAFPRQCPELGIKSFIENGVRPSLIPLLINYFQDRQMRVKWHGVMSKPRNINGGGPQGATLGILEYLSQSNDSASCVPLENSFKFIDDLTCLEIINLLSIGLASANVKQQVPSDLPEHGQIIPAVNLKSQNWLEQINEWTRANKMLINEKKCNSMIFNFTHQHQFTSRMQLNNQNIDFVESKKLLGTHITNDLKWDLNTSKIIRKANASMGILRKASSFGASRDDLKTLYIAYVRSHLEQSAVVWHSSLTKQNINDLERVQKSAVRIILGGHYENYQKALSLLKLETLEDRRKNLCLNFAKKCLKNARMKKMFPLNMKKHNMNTRHMQKYRIQFAKSERLKKSPLIYMQTLLNQEELSNT